ncbi:MAG TPA: hypothetical protein VJG49_04675 [Candidatus Nanoarchaeia archaeon]|nr:hypothetical protein [Candidatus Nanoarchaeia archaeon]
MIVDQSGNQIQELEAFAFLAETDQIPVIIGFNSLLEKLNVHFDFRKILLMLKNDSVQSFRSLSFRSI